MKFLTKMHSFFDFFLGVGTFWVDFFFVEIFQVNCTGVAGMTDLDVMHRCGVSFFVLNTRLRRILVGGQCINAFKLQGRKIVNFIARFQ